MLTSTRQLVTFTVLYNLRYIGPVVMGVGWFVVLCVAVVSYKDVEEEQQPAEFETIEDIYDKGITLFKQKQEQQRRREMEVDRRKSEGPPGRRRPSTASMTEDAISRLGNMFGSTRRRKTGFTAMRTFSQGHRGPRPRRASTILIPDRRPQPAGSEPTLEKQLPPPPPDSPLCSLHMWTMRATNAHFRRRASVGGCSPGGAALALSPLPPLTPGNSPINTFATLTEEAAGGGGGGGGGPEEVFAAVQTPNQSLVAMSPAALDDRGHSPVPAAATSSQTLAGIQE